LDTVVMPLSLESRGWWRTEATWCRSPKERADAAHPSLDAFGPAVELLSHDDALKLRESP
jgi:hypothetical protein